MTLLQHYSVPRRQRVSAELTAKQMVHLQLPLPVYDPFRVEQEGEGRELWQAQVPPPFPVELTSSYLGDDASVSVRFQCSSNLFNYDTIAW